MARDKKSFVPRYFECPVCGDTELYLVRQETTSTHLLQSSCIKECNGWDTGKEAVSDCTMSEIRCGNGHPLSLSDGERVQHFTTLEKWFEENLRDGDNPVHCCMCEWQGKDNQLLFIPATESEEAQHACPNCKTDGYLLDGYKRKTPDFPVLEFLGSNAPDRTIDMGDRTMAKAKEEKTGLVFTCPECGWHGLDSVEEVVIKFRITEIDKEGNLDYDTKNERREGGTVVSFQCSNCGFEPTDQQGQQITTGEDLVKWIKANKG